MNKKLHGILMAVLCVIFFSSVVVLLRLFFEYREMDTTYEKSVSQFITVAENKSAFKEAGEDNADAMPIAVDFEALQSINEDVAGWIYCEGTNIHYPVLQREDNEFYLNHAYDKTINRAGSIFIEAQNRPDFADSNTIIYGHHMKNGAMFATLSKWAKQEYYEEHPMFWLFTPKQNYRIILFSGYMTDVTSDAYAIYQEPCQEFDEYLQEVLANSDFKANVELDSNEKFVILSTCEYAFKGARYVLHGMLVPCEKEEK